MRVPPPLRSTVRAPDHGSRLISRPPMAALAGLIGALVLLLGGLLVFASG